MRPRRGPTPSPGCPPASPLRGALPNPRLPGALPAPGRQKGSRELPPFTPQPTLRGSGRGDDYHDPLHRLASVATEEAQPRQNFSCPLHCDETLIFPRGLCVCVSLPLSKQPTTGLCPPPVPQPQAAGAAAPPAPGHHSPTRLHRSGAKVCRLPAPCRAEPRAVRFRPFPLPSPRLLPPGISAFRGRPVPLPAHHTDRAGGAEGPGHSPVPTEPTGCVCVWGTHTHTRTDRVVSAKPAREPGALLSSRVSKDMSFTTE